MNNPKSVSETKIVYAKETIGNFDYIDIKYLQSSYIYKNVFKLSCLISCLKPNIKLMH